MSKRQLNKQQLRRIRQRLNTPVDETADDASGPLQRARIITHYGRQLLIENLADAKEYRCYARSNLPALAVGDYVAWRPLQDEEDSGVIEQLEPRHSLIERPHPHRGLKPVAANIQLLVIVIASEPAPHHNLIDRYLVAARQAGLQALLLLNKIDLLDAAAEEEYNAAFQLYQTLGYSFLKVSSETRQGIDALIAQLKNRTSIFVGQSGVGKSSLLNCLLPDADSKVARLSAAASKGRHTTTAAQLHALPDGGSIIDSPGIREFGLWHLDNNKVAEGFIEFEPFLGRCKFSNCTHHSEEEGCAIQQAVADGDIHPRRLDSYFAILASPVHKY